MFTAFHLTLNVMSQEESDTNRARLGSWLKLQREKARIGKKQVAKKVGISIQQIYRIENGQSGTRRETLDAICDFIGADKYEAYEIADLVRSEARLAAGYAPVGQLQRPDGERLLEYFNALPQAERSMLMTTAKALYDNYQFEAKQRVA